MKKKLFILPLFLFWLSNSLAQQSPFSSLELHSSEYYDEIWSDGEIRDLYKPLDSYLQSLTFKKQKSYLLSSREAFRGDNALDPVPRILSSEELMQIRQGVQQRARAIRAFLQDHYSGRREYLSAGLIPQSILKNIILRSGESAYEGKVNSETISFLYGPDIIRDYNGQWRIIEDNVGFIGGLGDLSLSYELTLKEHPDLKKYFEFADPEEFYSALAQAYKKQGELYGGKTILMMTPPYSDHEDQRIRQIFAKYGIETVTPNTAQQLEITESGVYLVSPISGQITKEKVGYIFLDDEHKWVDNTHPISQIYDALETAEEFLSDRSSDPKKQKRIKEILANIDPQTQLPDIAALQKILNQEYYKDRKSKFSGILQAMLDGKVGSSYSGGVDFVGDKEFYVYVPEFIRYYLHEEPLLSNIPTFKFIDEKTGEFKIELFIQVQSNKDQFVIKKVDGRGGDGVVVGKKSTAEDFQKILQKIKINPSSYIAQVYTHLSVHNGNIVDTRAISAVLPKEEIISQTLWGRGLPLNGNGKVNVSDKGREVTVLGVRPRKIETLRIRCEQVFGIGF